MGRPSCTGASRNSEQHGDSDEEAAKARKAHLGHVRFDHAGCQGIRNLVNSIDPVATGQRMSPSDSGRRIRTEEITTRNLSPVLLARGSCVPFSHVQCVADNPVRALAAPRRTHSAGYRSPRPLPLLPTTWTTALSGPQRPFTLSEPQRRLASSISTMSHAPRSQRG